MTNRQLMLVCSLILFVGMVAMLPAEFVTFGTKHEGKTGLKSMVADLNTNFGQVRHIEAGKTTTVLQTTSTNTFTTSFLAPPMVLVTDTNGVVQTNVYVISSNKFTVTWGATNITYKWYAIDVN